MPFVGWWSLIYSTSDQAQNQTRNEVQNQENQAHTALFLPLDLWWTIDRSIELSANIERSIHSHNV